MNKFVLLLAPALMFAACSPPEARQETREIPKIEMSETARLTMQRVNEARFVSAPTRPDPAAQTQQASASNENAQTAAPAATAPAYDGGLVRIQVLLDRLHFSPGVIDGYDGENVRKAVAAYQEANNLPINGRPDDALLTRLEGADSQPALVAYVLTEEDVGGPFVQVPQGLEAQSRLDALGYGSAVEAVAEKFHMDEDLLRSLNPGVDFSSAGTEIVVASVGGGLDGQVARIDIDKDELTLRAYDASDRMLAFYPVTISADNTPTGELEVTAIAFDPTYNYDADELPSFNDNSGREFVIQPGPNNPVGLVWIALNRDGYGIHGTPNPQLISKTASHGCVRLTNWDAVDLARATQQGVPVHFREGGAQARRETSRG
ncbi:MAG TPA: L,D-transpeptidase [Candidatus Binatia bacterium]|nr:L,D-transpeptidase [Candidatus Binatia bacterium]